MDSNKIYKIAVIRSQNDDSDDLLIHGIKSCDVTFYSNIKDYGNTLSDTDFVIIDTDDFSLAKKHITQIRSSSLFLLPIFTLHENLHILVDVVFNIIADNIAEFIKFTEVMALQKDAISGLTNIRGDWRSKFLVYLYTRKGYKQLELMKNRDSKFSYYYPILTAFDTYHDADANLDWIAGLKEDGMLVSTQLINAVFCCKTCKSSHILISEVCEECGSLEVEVTDFFSLLLLWKYSS